MPASSRRRVAPRHLRPRLLELALDGGEPPLEIPLFLFEALHLAARTTYFPVRASSAAASSIIAAARLSVFRRTVIFSCAAQYFSRAVAGFPGRVLQALARHVPTAGSHLVALLEQPWRLIERGGLRRWFGGFRGPVLC